VIECRENSYLSKDHKRYSHHKKPPLDPTSFHNLIPHFSKIYVLECYAIICVLSSKGSFLYCASQLLRIHKHLPNSSALIW